MSDEQDQVEILRKEFWRLEKAAAGEADLKALGSDVGDREDYDPGFTGR